MKAFFCLLKTILLLKIIQYGEGRNLICNGDFEGNKLLLRYRNEPYAYLNSNNSCWFNKNGGQYQIKEKVYPPVGATAELTLTSAYILCQNVVLEVGRSYQLNFTLVNGWTMTYSTVIVTVNEAWIMNLTALNQFSIVNGSVIFTANVTKNKLCFDPRFNIGNQAYAFIGPCIDNVTLVKLSPSMNTSNISNTSNTNNTDDDLNNTSTTNSSNPIISNTTSSNNITNNSTETNTTNSTTPLDPPIPFKQIIFQIYCVTNRQEREEITIVNCKYQDERIQSIIKIVQEKIQFYMNDQLQNQAKLTEIKSNTLKFVVIPKRSYDLKKIAIVIPDHILENQSSPYRLIFYIDGYNLVFSLLNTNQIGIINSVYPISELAMDIVQKIYSVLKASFFSYFLVDIISFWNLSIMYNFLNLRTAPLFSKYFLQKLERIIFRLNSIMKWASGKIPQLKQALNFQYIQGRELIASYQYKFVWFGYFGISSGYMSSNTEQLVVVVLLIFKLGILTVIRRWTFLPKVFRKLLPGKHKKIQIFLNELIGLNVFMIVSAGGSLCYFGFEVAKEKMNTLAQVLTLFIGIIVMPLYFLNQISKHKKKYKKKLARLVQQLQKKSHKNIDQIITHLNKKRRKQFITSINNILQFIPFVTIPFLIVFDNSTLFLIVHTFVFGFRLWWVWKYLRVLCKGCVEKVFLVLNLGIWLVHHFVYMIFWVLERLAVVNQWSDYSGEAFQCIKICGFITIFTVICGGLLELLRFIISIICFLFKEVKKICEKITTILDEKSLKQSSQTAKNVKKETNNKKELAVVKLYNEDTKSQKPVVELSWNRVKVRVHFKNQKGCSQSKANVSKPKKKNAIRKQKS